MKKATPVKTVADLTALISRTAKRHGYVTKRLLYQYATQYAIEKAFPNDTIFQRFMAKKFPNVPTRQGAKSVNLHDAILELLA